ncbi:MAG: DUF4240 domain-containing protein, partial [Armatimonadota bacterium]|nr:DUF4240 domain-containing protein [Armatimonadota bacterium]
DMWGVAYIINGNCSDDGFEYFLCWLIGQGKEAYEAAKVSPDSAGNLVSPDDMEVECESLLGAADAAYEQVTGGEMPYNDIAYPKEPAGEQWSDEDLPRLFPALEKRSPGA